MPLYLLQGSYTAAAAAAMVKKPTNRLKVVTAVVERLGGTVEGGWMTFGQHDYAFICKFRDNVAAASMALAVAAGGAISHNQTTPLLTYQEGLKAMKRASKAGYKAPK